MSASDGAADSAARAVAFADRASEIAAACAEAIEADRLDDVPDDALGQLIASAIRVYAAKVQNGTTPRPFARNSGVTPTDVAIGCTAMLQGVNLEVFELGAWQQLSGLGRLDLPPGR
jgi:hypothetical protein